MAADLLGGCPRRVVVKGPLTSARYWQPMWSLSRLEKFLVVAIVVLSALLGWIVTAVQIPRPSDATIVTPRFSAHTN
jgi:hypothetical protein